MIFYAIKTAISALLIVAISEIAKRSSFIGALLASLPLVSVLAMLWLYADTKDTGKISSLSSQIFWLVIPSLVLFAALPVLLKHGLGFYWSLLISMALTVAAYFLLLTLLRQFGIQI